MPDSANSLCAERATHKKRGREVREAISRIIAAVHFQSFPLFLPPPSISGMRMRENESSSSFPLRFHPALFCLLHLRLFSALLSSCSQRNGNILPVGNCSLRVRALGVGEHHLLCTRQLDMHQRRIEMEKKEEGRL